MFDFQIDENLKPQLRSSIKDLYQGDHAMDAISVLWNAVMLKVDHASDIGPLVTREDRY